MAQIYIDSLKYKTTARDVRNALSHFQRQSLKSSEDQNREALNKAYKDVMERIDGQQLDFRKLAKKVLMWITCANRPLTTAELRHALAVVVGDSKLDEDNFAQTQTIVSVCAGLVTIDKESEIIRLVHYTTQEYLEQTKMQWFPDAQATITTTCVTYLSFDEFGSGICQNDEEFEQRLQLNKLYDYAAHNWGHHAREASTSCHGVLEFLQKQAEVEASSQALMAVKDQWIGRVTTYSQDVPKQITGLHLAAYFGIYNAVQDLLDNNNNPNLKDSYNRTPLSWAAESGHETVVKLLLENGAELEAKDQHNRTPLLWAAENGHETVVKLLLENGAELEARDQYSRTPLLWAAKNGYETVVKLLLENGAELEAKDQYSRTPLLWAAENEYEAVVELLQAKGANVSIENKSG